MHRVAAAVLQRGMAGRDALTVLKGLDDRGALAALLSAGALAAGLADLLWPEVETLKRAGAASGKEIQCASRLHLSALRYPKHTHGAPTP